MAIYQSVEITHGLFAAPKLSVLIIMMLQEVQASKNGTECSSFRLWKTSNNMRKDSCVLIDCSVPKSEVYWTKLQYVPVVGDPFKEGWMKQITPMNYLLTYRTFSMAALPFAIFFWFPLIGGLARLRGGGGGGGLICEVIETFKDGPHPLLWHGLLSCVLMSTPDAGIR